MYNVQIIALDMYIVHVQCISLQTELNEAIGLVQLSALRCNRMKVHCNGIQVLCNVMTIYFDYLIPGSRSHY